MNYKKILKILAIALLSFITILIAAPYLFKGKIKELVLKSVNENVNAKVAFNDVNLSFFSSFPQVSLTLEDLSVINIAPFENDTLTFVKVLALDMPIKELFKSSGEAISITGISIKEAYLSLKSNKDGFVNYDIMKASEIEDSTEKAMVFDIKNYEIINSTIKYVDEASNMIVEIKEFNHTGSGDFSAEQSKLDTKSSANLSFKYDGVTYFENSELVLDALIAMDLKTNTYSFLENEATINGLPLTFDGKIILYDTEQQIDINFKTPTSSFKNFLAVMPKEYSSKLDEVKTEGDFTVNGYFKGTNNDLRIPGFEINIASNNASFKYPDLPKGVNDITIKTLIKNETGLIKDTYVNIDALNFRIDQDVFKSSANIVNLTTNPVVNAVLKGTINLANISKTYPIKMEQQLSGILKMDVTTSFDMEAVEKSNYARIKNNGNVTLTDFIYNSSDFINPFNIAKASVNFTPQQIMLNQFNATTGKTDISATGTLQDVIGFVVSKKDLKGNFALTSNVFSVNDFMSDDKISEENSTKSRSPIKVPSFLDCTITADAKTVIYDNLQLKNMKGKMIIKDEKVTLEDVNSSLFGGIITVNGNVSTKEATPTFSMDLGMNTFDILESFNGMDLLKSLAPIANIVQGKMNSTIKISGNLSEEFTPDLKSVSGNVVAQLLSQNIDPKNSPLLNTLASQLNFIDINKLNLQDIKTHLSFENGKVNVKPFTLKYNDIDITIGGSHGFDKSMDYEVTFNVPGKYLGNEVTSLLTKMSKEDISKVKVPVTANITGNFAKPIVKTDYKKTVTNLTSQLIYYNKLKDKGSSILNNLIKVPTQQKDTTAAITTSPKVDVTKPKEAVDNLVKNKLNSLLSGKKKQKDTLN